MMPRWRHGRQAYHKLKTVCEPSSVQRRQHNGHRHERTDTVALTFIASALVRDPKYQDRVVAETRALLSTISA
jgi:hypothetical protein